MKKLLSLLFLLCIFSMGFAQVHTSYLWHLQQPIYWPEQSQNNPNRYQAAKESDDIKNAGGNNYGTGTSHPTNNLAEIFGNDDRKNVYQHGARNSVNQLLGYPDAGAQVNYSGCLIENVNSLANANQWGYYPGWEQNYAEARGWQTSGGFPRLDIVGFTFHHAIGPLISDRAFRKELQAHKHIYGNTFGNSPVYTKGYWPAECCFSVRNIKVLYEEGFEWSVIANSHLSRTLNDYPLSYGTNGCNISPPNPADKVPTNGNNWWSGQIDGRGGTFAAPYCYQAHKAQYIDPATGTEYLLDVVPMGDLLSYRDGYSPQGTDDINAHIVPYNDPNHNSIVLFAHDGDNAWGGGSSYYFEAVPSFVNAASSDPNLHPTTVQQFLNDNPVPADDIIHVEDGGWVNAANDWGHPQFINWLWPIYNNSTYEFDPDGWTEDFRNWAVITAIDNYACMAEDLDGNVDIADVVSPSGSSSEAEKAWHFYLPALTSGYMYYGTAEDMEVKQTIAGNNAIAHAENVINAHSGTDNTPPSVFIPQRFPYNPGGPEFGPIYGYQEHISSKDFTVWTLAYDVSGMQSVTLKYRVDTGDEVNALDDNENDTYTGGSGVSYWYSLPMTQKVLDPAYNAGNPEIDFFVLPDAIADLYHAEITGLSDTLVDYYVEAVDNNGNTFKTPIQHVFVGDQEGGGGGGNDLVYWEPSEPTLNDQITVYSEEAVDGSMLHWGVNGWTAPDESYWPTGTVPFNSDAVQSPFSDPDGDGLYTCVIGPFNDPTLVVDEVNFVVKIAEGNWNNNGGQDYLISIENNPSENPVGSNQSISMMQDETYTFSTDDFYFQGQGGATFAGIRITGLPGQGDLEYNGNPVSINTDYPDVSLLTFTPAPDQAGVPYTSFQFKVIDSEGRYSESAYNFTINVYNQNPVGANASALVMVDESYVFSEADFYFQGQGGASFAGIRIETTVSDGMLNYDGSPVTDGTDCPDVSLLTFTPEEGASGTPYTSFSFKVVDSEGRYSDAAYTFTFNVMADWPDGVSWFPEFPQSNEVITIAVNNDPNMSASSVLHWGVNKNGSTWTTPNTAYWPEGTTLFNGTGPAVETPFTNQGDGLYTVELGPFDDPAQVVNTLHFVLHYGGDNWNNNGGMDWNIDIEQYIGISNIEHNISAKIYPNPMSVSANIVVEADERTPMRISLVDITGRVLQQKRIEAPRTVYIQKGKLNPGLYFIRFENTRNGHTFIEKLIVQ